MAAPFLKKGRGAPQTLASAEMNTSVRTSCSWEKEFTAARLYLPFPQGPAALLFY